MKEDTIDYIRQLYGYIFIWHKEIGIRRYKEIYGNRFSEDEQYYIKYISLCEEMPSPNIAKIEMIEIVANEVICGCMEWSYNERYMNEKKLSIIAHEIIELINSIENEDSENDTETKLRKLINYAEEESIEPQVVEILIPHEANLKECYQLYALKAYSDISSNFENLGGQIVLADTNFEKEMSVRHPVGSRQKIKFRNSAAMNFAAVTEKNSLVVLVKAGKITIEHVTIGS